MHFGLQLLPAEPIPVGPAGEEEEWPEPPELAAEWAEPPEPVAEWLGVVVAGAAVADWVVAGAVGVSLGGDCTVGGGDVATVVGLVGA